MKEQSIPSLFERITPLCSRMNLALSRVHELISQTENSLLQTEALFFSLERCAWMSIEIASTLVFELRLGIARKEPENFDLLQRAEYLALDEARRLKQLCEYRNLSLRDPLKLDLAYLLGDLSEDLPLFQEWGKKAERIALC